MLAGGPGQAASDLYVSYAGAFARVNRNHDIVLLDQRGTGLSEPLFCDYPEDWRETRDELPAVKQATLDCLARYGERVRYYTSSIAVQDLERVRTALGYEQIDLYGASYGTRMAELYLRRHADAVQAVILDGVTDPEQAIGPDTPLDGQRALDLILERAAGGSPECAAAYPGLRGDFGALAHQVRAGLDVVDAAGPLDAVSRSSSSSTAACSPRRCACCRTTPPRPRFYPP